MSSCHYEIDRDDRILSVGGEWTAFAVANGAPDLRPEKVIGRSLWEHIHGQETRYLYERLFERVRRDGRSRTLPFRCDGPDRRRYMQLEIAGLGGGRLGFTSILVREEPRERLYVGFGPVRPGALLRVCSWCKRVAIQDRWVEVEEAIARLDLFDEAELPPITHGLCPPCHEDFVERL